MINCVVSIKRTFVDKETRNQSFDKIPDSRSKIPEIVDTLRDIDNRVPCGLVRCGLINNLIHFHFDAAAVYIERAPSQPSKQHIRSESALNISRKSRPEIANKFATNSSSSNYRFFYLSNHSIAPLLSLQRRNHDGTGFRYLFLRINMSDAEQ